MSERSFQESALGGGTQDHQDDAADGADPERGPADKLLPGTGRVLLLCPRFHAYGEAIAEGVRTAGGECLLLDERDCSSGIAKIVTRLRLRQKWPPAMDRYDRHILDRSARFAPDAILIVNPEMATPSLVAELRRQHPGVAIVLYIWDPMYRKPATLPLLEVVDAAYSFDLNDCRTHADLHHVPMFHNLDLPPGGGAPTRYAYSFVGSTQARRIGLLARVARKLDAEGKSYFFFLYAPSIAHYLLFRLMALVAGYRGTISRTPLAFTDYLQVVADSRVVIDIERPGQSGITARTVEVLFSGKPLLTTNHNILLYDFMPHVSAAFLDQEGHWEEPPEIAYDAGWLASFRKYHVTNWLATLLSRAKPQYLRREQA